MDYRDSLGCHNNLLMILCIALFSVLACNVLLGVAFVAYVHVMSV